MAERDYEEYDELFKSYLQVCNKAIEQNKDSFPYKQIWDAGSKFLDDSAINIAVYDDRPIISYSVRFNNGEISANKNEISLDGKPWKVTYSYLKKVIDNPDEYIKHPARLDWQWIKSRIKAM